MKNFVSRHPYLFAIGIFVANALLAFPFVIAFNVFELDKEPLRLIIPIVQSIFVVGILYHLGWLQSSGFGKRIKDIRVLWFPLVLAFIPVVMFGTVEIAAYSVLFYTLALVFTGISEEGEARAIILKAILPKGKWIALIFAALLFSVGHFTNLFFEDFSAIEMIEKLVVTFSFAILYGALFLRTLNIWPLITLHMVHDFMFLVSGTAGPFTTEPLPVSLHIVLGVASLAYGIYIVKDVDIRPMLQETQNAST
jgi:hypothetical protein